MSKYSSESRTGISRWAAVGVILLATLLSIVVVWCMEPGEAAAADLTYVYVDDQDQVHIVDREHQWACETEALQFRPDESSADLQILLSRKQTATVVRGEEVHVVTTRRETVENLLRRLKIEPTQDEMVYLHLEEDGVHVDLVKQFFHNWQTQVSVPYETERRSNPLLEKGTERVVQEGLDATVTETYQDTYEKGVIVSTDLVGTTDEAPVTEIVEYGTLVTSVSRDDRIASVHYDDDGQGGYLTFVSGDTLKFSYVTICNATAYALHGYTASGYPTEMGNIAVDTSVFPYGTRFFIQTTSGSWVYGMAVARDCGSGIKGNKIDLWFDEYATACSWGRRDCTVYVLG